MDLKISARLSSIKAMRLSENKLEWTPPGATIDQEQKFLQVAIENHRQTIQKNKDVLDRRPGEDLEILKAAGYFWVMPIYVLLAIGCPFFGFLGWYRKIQRPSEEAHVLDCKLKETTIRKTEVEIRELYRSKKFAARH
jgi:hypothetical protein